MTYWLTVTTARRRYALRWRSGPLTRFAAALVRASLVMSTLSEKHYRYRGQRVLLSRLELAK